MADAPDLSRHVAPIAAALAAYKRLHGIKPGEPVSAEYVLDQIEWLKPPRTEA